MYTSGPSANQLKELEAAGFSADDVVTDDVDIWPENLPAYELFDAVGTQWRIDNGHPTGLENDGVLATLLMMRVPRKEWPQLFEDLRVMERAALSAMAERE